MENSQYFHMDTIVGKVNSLAFGSCS